VIKYVKRAPCKQKVRIKPHIGKNLLGHGEVISYMNVAADYYYIFAEHHLPCAEKRTQHFHPLARIALLNTHYHQVVGNARGRHVELANLRGYCNFDGCKEYFFSSFSYPSILHGRHSYYCGGIDCIFSVGNAGDMEHRIEVGKRIKAGVITKRPLGDRGFGRVNISFYDEIRVGRYPQVVGKAFDQGHSLTAQECCKEVLIDIFRQRSRGNIGINRVSSEGYSDRHPPSPPLPCLKVPGTGLVPVPVHSCPVTAHDLHAVHAEVVFSGLRVSGMHQWEGYEPFPVMGPAFQDGQPVKVRCLLHHLLAFTPA